MRTPVSCSPMLLVGGPTVGRIRHLKLQQQVRKAQHSHYGMSPAYSIPVLSPAPTFQPPTTRMHLCHARRCCSAHASTAASWVSFLGDRQQHAYMLGVSLQAQAPWGTPTYLHATCRSSKLLIPLLLANDVDLRTLRDASGASKQQVSKAQHSPNDRHTPEQSMTTLYAYVPYTYRPHAALAQYAIMLEYIGAHVAQHPTCLWQQ